MKHLIAALIAPIALLAAPVAAQTLGPDEIELRIEALGETPADSATVPVQIVGRGTTEALAKADLAKKEKEVRADLVRLGIPAAKIETVDDDAPQYAVVQAETADPSACAAEAAEAAKDAASRMRFASEPAAAFPAPVLAATTATPGCERELTTNRMLLVTVEDLTKLPAIAKLGGGDDYYVRTSGYFFHRDKAASHQAAIAEAIAKARADAEVYAAAMNMRVLRIVRVGNVKPKINWPDMFNLFSGFVGGLDVETAEDMAIYDLRAFAAAEFAGVTIDFVLAPK